MNWRVDPHAAESPSQQLVAAVADAIARGELQPGDRLPSVRQMAQEALVNPNTVGKSYRELEFLGLTAGKNGSGVFVCAAATAKARSLRRAATWDALQAAFAAALAAGHLPADLLEALLEESR